MLEGIVRKLLHPTTPVVSSSPPETIVSAQTLSSTYVRSSVLNVNRARRVILTVDVDAGDAGNSVKIIPLVSYDEDEPATTDDSWFCLTEADIASAVLPSGTLAAGTAFTLSPEFAQSTVRPLLISLEDTDAATDEIRVSIPLEVAGARWFHVQVSDQGIGTTAATVTLKAVAVA